MTIKITIIEDQRTDQEQLIRLLKSWGEENQIKTEITCYPSGEAYFKTNPSHDSDVFFLDIQLGKMDGLTIAKQLRSESYKGSIIFLTVFQEYVFEGYSVHALNYLLKPVTPATLIPCLEEIRRKLSGSTYLFRSKQETIQIPYRDILTFTSSSHYVDILTTGNIYHQYTQLKKIIPLLPPEFIQCHRSHIVNMDHIYNMNSNIITLSNRMKVPIGRSYLEPVHIAFIRYASRMDSF